MNKKVITLPNFITAIRMIGTVCFIPLEPFTLPFYIIYTICGVSDIADGIVARLTGAVSEFGAKLDSVADLFFYTTMLVKILPKLRKVLPRWIWIAVGILLFMRAVTYFFVAVKFKRFASIHTYLNKLTGATVFAVPYFLTTRAGVGLCIIICVIAVFAVTEEILIHAVSREYDPDIHSVIELKKKQNKKEA